MILVLSLGLGRFVVKVVLVFVLILRLGIGVGIGNDIGVGWWGNGLGARTSMVNGIGFEIDIGAGSIWAHSITLSNPIKFSIRLPVCV